MALACPRPMARLSRNDSTCLISTFGSDGAGRRMEAALTCLAAAHDQELHYVHTPFLTLQHGVSAARANDFLGLSLLRHCWPQTVAAAAVPRCGKCGPAKLEPGSPYAMGSKYIVEETGKQCADSTSRNKSFLADIRTLATCDARTVHCECR